MKKTFSIISLGCPRNLVDSETIISNYKKMGYVYRDELLGNDELVINTCAFIDDAKEESIDVILKAIDAKKRGDIKKISVVGCLPERYAGDLKNGLKEIDEIKGVVGLKRSFKRDAIDKLTPSHYAYIKISEGCRNSCSYCVIPRIKGPYKSRAIKSILDEAKGLLQHGTKEIILVGQDTSLYGTDLYKSQKLSELLKGLEKISADIWIRLLYLHPANLKEDIINVIRDSKNICRYIDLPIEHISDRLLKLMKRRITKREIISLIEYIRKNIPDVAIRTSFIVGFPCEAEKDHRELISFIKDMKFERMGLFRYSMEEGTYAYGLKGHVSEEMKKKRFDEAMLTQQDISKKLNERFKHKTIKVLIDGKEDNIFIGRSEYDAPEVDGIVYVNGTGLKIGQFYSVDITDTYEYDLVGQYEPCK